MINYSNLFDPYGYTSSSNSATPYSNLLPNGYQQTVKNPDFGFLDFGSVGGFKEPIFPQDSGGIYGNIQLPQIPQIPQTPEEYKTSSAPTPSPSPEPNPDQGLNADWLAQHSTVPSQEQRAQAPSITVPVGARVNTSYDANGLPVSQLPQLVQPEPRNSVPIPSGGSGPASLRLGQAQQKAQQTAGKPATPTPTPDQPSSPFNPDNIDWGSIFAGFK